MDQFATDTILLRCFTAARAALPVRPGPNSGKCRQACRHGGLRKAAPRSQFLACHAGLPAGIFSRLFRKAGEFRNGWDLRSRRGLRNRRALRQRRELRSRRNLRSRRDLRSGRHLRNLRNRRSGRHLRNRRHLWSRRNLRQGDLREWRASGSIAGRNLKHRRVRFEGRSGITATDLRSKWSRHRRQHRQQRCSAGPGFHNRVGRRRQLGPGDSWCLRGLWKAWDRGHAGGREGELLSHHFMSFNERLAQVKHVRGVNLRKRDARQARQSGYAERGRGNLGQCYRRKRKYVGLHRRMNQHDDLLRRGVRNHRCLPGINAQASIARAKHLRCGRLGKGAGMRQLK